MSGVEGLAFQRLSMFDATIFSSYDSLSNIRTVANKYYMTVRPFAIGNNGKQVSHEVINALYHPDLTALAFARER